MNKDGYYINTDGIKTIIKYDFISLNIVDKNIVELVCNNNLKYLYFDNNNIKSEYFKLNDNLEKLWCYNNKITNLILNDKLQDLACDINTKLFNIPKTCSIHIYE